MRKKVKEEDKHVKFGITIHPELDKLLNDMVEEKNITKSKIIQEIMFDHFKNKKNIDD